MLDFLLSVYCTSWWFISPVIHPLSLRLLSSRPSRLTLACRESDGKSPVGTEAVPCCRNRRSRLFSPCCADHISAIPPTITTTTSPMQSGPIISPSLGIDQRAGESHLAGREGGSYHVSKVGGKASSSARSMTRAAVRMERSLVLGGPVPSVNVCTFLFSR